MHDLVSGFEFVTHGGFMMIPLLASALVALTVILERFFMLQRRYVTPRERVAEIFAQVKARKFSAIESNTPVADVLAAGIEHFQNPPVEMELAMKNRAEEWIPLLEKRIEVIDTVITAAPLMGLLGTITGMMASFRVLSEKGVNEPNAITGGVAEALIATATGLVIALICLVAYNYLTARVKGFIYEIEAAASRLTELRLMVDREGRK
ncbi:MAG: MotA/TolQ/ExbB proton channel family protein [Bdellovibrionota bacterium]